MVAERPLASSRPTSARIDYARAGFLWRPRTDGHGVRRSRSDGSGRTPDPVPPDGVAGVWPAPLRWGELTDRDRDVYEIGFVTGFLMREDEVAQANADADRFYRIAFDRQHPRRR